MKAYRWVRSHPYTTATPFVLVTFTAVITLVTGWPWWVCAVLVAAFSGIAFWNSRGGRRAHQ